MREVRAYCLDLFCALCYGGAVGIVAGLTLGVVQMVVE
jgi:hypothetical protein